MKQLAPHIQEEIRWLTNEAFPGLRDELARIINDPKAKPQKTTRVRRIFLLPEDERHPALVLKEFITRGFGARVRALFLGHQAKREHRALCVLKKAGVAAPQIAALGVQPGALPRKSWLALVYLDNTLPLEEMLLNSRLPQDQRRRLTVRVGRLIRKMHDAGVLHNDLHSGNILVDSGGQPHILDLHGAFIKKKLSHKHRKKDLISLAGAFMIHGKMTDRLRFLKAYAGSTFKSLVKELEGAARKRLYFFMEKFDMRSMRPCRIIQRVSVQDLSGMGERSERSKKLALFLDPYSQAALEKKGKLLHQGTHTRIFALEMDHQTYIVKSYTRPGISKEMKRIFEGSPARRSWINYHKLMFRGIGVPKPVLYLEEPLPGPAGRSLLVTEGDLDYITLDKFIKKGSRDELLTIISRLAAMIARMHQLFLRNRDMKAQNILVGPSLDVQFIDPDGVKSMMDPSLYFMAKDLMRLNASFPPNGPVSKADRLRFLKAYMVHMRLPSQELRKIWRETYFLTWAKWDQWYEASKKAVK